MPPASSVEREEERRVNMRTLLVASAASAVAAAVTSQLWIAGTWVAAALTPALVALLSEAMHRPTERIARAWTTEREVPRPRAQTATRDEPAALRGTAGPVRVYRQSGGGTRLAGRSRRRIAVGAVAATAAIAFVIGIATLTTVDLVSGGSVGKGSGRTTAFGGGSRQPNDNTKDATPSGQSSPGAQKQQDATTPTTPPASTAPPPASEPPSSDTTPVTPPANPTPDTPATP
jgi:hypothetical protein